MHVGGQWCSFLASICMLGGDAAHEPPLGSFSYEWGLCSPAASLR